jgi:hypothetical protein
MENTQLQLTITDLATIRNIIDLAVSRGAFRASEVKVVGETFERLDAFLTVLEQSANQAVSENQSTGNNKETQGEHNHD